MAAPYEALKPVLIRIVQTPSDDKLKHKSYRHTVDHAEEMSVHLSGTKPEKLLKRVRPREDPAITAYRLQSYEPTTESTAGKALTITGKIFKSKTGAIKPADGSDGQKLYQWGTVNYPVFNSVMNFLSEYGLKKTMEDPNGVFLVEPVELPKDEYGNVDTTKQLEPIVTCFDSKDIWLKTPQYVVFFIKYMETGVGNAARKEWFFKYVDREAIFNFTMWTSDSTNYIIDETFVYPHKFGEFPFWNTGGYYDTKMVGLFKSYFYPAVPFWNKAITAASDLDGAFVSHLHPQKWEVAEECEFVQHTDHGDYPCIRGEIFDTVKVTRSQCSHCGGSGRKSVKGPHSTYQVARDKLVDGAGNSLNQPPAGYIDVPTAATQMLVEREDRLLEQGLSALAMDIVTKIGNNQSGEAKSYDRSELFDFLQMVADLFYDKHLKNIFYFFGRYMFINKSKEELATIEPTIIKPTEFDIRSTEVLTEQLKTAKGSSINAAYLQAKQIEVQNKDFSQHPELLPYLNLSVMLDPLAEQSRTDVNLMVLDGSVSKKTVIIHDNIREFVRKALEEDKGFADLEYSKQMEKLGQYAEEIQEQIEEENEVTLEAEAAAMIETETEPEPDDTPAA